MELGAALRGLGFHGCLHNSGGLAYCRNGANRSCTFMCAYLMCKHGMHQAPAERYIFRLRKICDLCKRDDDEVHPRALLSGIQDRLHDLFPERIPDFEHEPLPAIVTLHDLRSMCQTHPTAVMQSKAKVAAKLASGRASSSSSFVPKFVPNTNPTGPLFQFTKIQDAQSS